MASIAAIVTTLNEEERIAECLGRLGFADEVLVVDSFSADRTAEIAGKLGRASSSTNTALRHHRRIGLWNRPRAIGR